MHPTTDQYWSEAYHQGRDYTAIKTQDVSRFLQYADAAAPKTCLDIGCGTGQLKR